MKFFRHIILFVTILVTQQLTAQRFNAGFSGGLVVSDIDGADTRDTDNDFHKLGFTLGGVVNTQLTKKTLLQFEINFIQKGSMQPPDSLNNGYFKIALGYVEIPLLIRRQIYFNWKGKKINKFDLEAGVSYGKMVQRKVIGNTNYVISNTSDYYNTNDVSVLVGADYNFTKNVLFCFRYSNSVIPVIKRNNIRPGFYSYAYNKGNNLVFQFSFKFLFGAVQKTQLPPAETITP
ncbi:MAG: PorT family protein [Bacteroidetes bacterium]|nr:PorT family protein [Bacteroidota bacterium]